MASVSEKLGLGDKITVRTIRGREDQVISRLPDGRVALFDQDSPYFKSLAPGQSVECHITVVHENYVILNPINEPEKTELVHLPFVEEEEIVEDDIVEDLEKLVENVSGNAKVISKALLRIIRLQQLQLKILRGEASNEKPTIEPPSVSYDLDKYHVRERKAPESELLQYLEEVKAEGPLTIKLEDFGSVGDIPKDMRLLTMAQTKYLKQHHLRLIDGYKKIEEFSAFFSEASALARGEYGNVFYAARGTNQWDRVQKITTTRDNS